jgi:hypothetical protein
MSDDELETQKNVFFLGSAANVVDYQGTTVNAPIGHDAYMEHIGS